MTTTVLGGSRFKVRPLARDQQRDHPYNTAADPSTESQEYMYRNTLTNTRTHTKLGFEPMCLLKVISSKDEFPVRSHKTIFAKNK